MPNCRNRRRLKTNRPSPVPTSRVPSGKPDLTFHGRCTDAFIMKLQANTLSQRPDQNQKICTQYNDAEKNIVVHRAFRESFSEQRCNTKELDNIFVMSSISGMAIRRFRRPVAVAFSRRSMDNTHGAPSIPDPRQTLHRQSRHLP